MTVLDLQPESAVETDPVGLNGLNGLLGAGRRFGRRHVCAWSGSGRLSPLDQVVEYAIDWFLVHLDPGEN